MNDKLNDYPAERGELFTQCIKAAKEIHLGSTANSFFAPVMSERRHDQVMNSAKEIYEYLTKPADPLKDFDLDSNKVAMPDMLIFGFDGSKSDTIAEFKTDGPDLNALRREVFTTIGAQKSFDSIEVVKMMGESAQENMFRDFCQVDLQICEKGTENLHHDGETMTKVFKAIKSTYSCNDDTCQCCEQDVMDIISAMQNAGILFREHEKSSLETALGHSGEMGIRDEVQSDSNAQPFTAGECSDTGHEMTQAQADEANEKGHALAFTSINAEKMWSEMKSDKGIPDSLSSQILHDMYDADLRVCSSSETDMLLEEFVDGSVEELQLWGGFVRALQDVRTTERDGRRSKLNGSDIYTFYKALTDSDTVNLGLNVKS